MCDLCASCLVPQLVAAGPKGTGGVEGETGSPHSEGLRFFKPQKTWEHWLHLGPRGRKSGVTQSTEPRFDAPGGTHSLVSSRPFPKPLHMPCLGQPTQLSPPGDILPPWTAGVVLTVPVTPPLV